VSSEGHAAGLEPWESFMSKALTGMPCKGLCWLALLTLLHVCPREEGSNGDREMSAAVHAAGLEPWDITMSDLLMGRARLDSFKGIVFVGGFSYADVLDSAKGWAGTIRRNSGLWQQFQAFYDRCGAPLFQATAQLKRVEESC
jgi:hypothetical protein